MARPNINKNKNPPPEMAAGKEYTYTACNVKPPDYPVIKQIRQMGGSVFLMQVRRPLGHYSG